MNYEITVKLTEDNNPVYLYFIDSMSYPQKGFKTYDEAFKAGLSKVKELKANKK